MMSIDNDFKAKKKKDFLITPIKNVAGSDWQGHHATNPCVVRFSKDPRVFLGYRAGGDDDLYFNGNQISWGSTLGLAILDENGSKVEQRFLLPIMKIKTDVSLPQNQAEYDEYSKLHKDENVILHDFRFWEYNDYLYVIYHDGSIKDCYDSISRMPVDTFLSKVDESIELLANPVDEIIERWDELWWGEDVWQPAGFEGKNRIFSSDVQKGDTIFFELGDGTLQMCHRPFSEAMAVLNTGSDTFAKPTEDGLTTYGSFETCARPGYTDNSHVGSNGLPTRAKIGDVDVYIDITHGVFNRCISESDIDHPFFRYYPYFRIKDYETGRLLYYSEEPILDFCDQWKEYDQEGQWISTLDHLEGVMFCGGQIEVVAGKNGLDDEFITYVGLGDTAIGVATFKLRDLIPKKVIDDIQARKEHGLLDVGQVRKNTFQISPETHGWQWSIENDADQRCLSVIRKLDYNGINETGVREINTAPGTFDADMMIFDGKSAKLVEGLGWVILYKGIRWKTDCKQKVTTAGCGVLLIDAYNPEKVLYRASEPLPSSITDHDGWHQAEDVEYSHLLDHAENFIPPRVISRINRIHELQNSDDCHPLLSFMLKSQMVLWLRKKAGLEDKGLSIESFSSEKFQFKNSCYIEIKTDFISKTKLV